MGVLGISEEYSAIWCPCRWVYQVSRRSVGRVELVITRFRSSLCFHFDVAGYCCRSLFRYCSSIPFAYAYRCLFIADHCHLDCGHLHIAAVGNLHAVRSNQMRSKSSNMTSGEGSMPFSVLSPVGILASVHISTLLQFFFVDFTVSDSIFSNLLQLL